MNLELDPADRAFRDEVRDFFTHHTPAQFKARIRTGMRLEPEEYTTWQKLLYGRGWGAPSWPKEYGGTGWNPTQHFIFESEAARADAPMQFHQGLELIGPIIFTYGNAEQKAKYLPAIVSGDDWWCQGYSEPNSGSDLASLTTTAVRDGDHYVISGQKAWTSYAHVANRMFLLARTDPEARKQAGISLFVLDIDTPGITIRPVITLDEVHHTNEVFLDDVRIPVAGLLGEEGRGWGYGKALLDRERGVTAAFTLRLSQQLRGLLEAAATMPNHGSTMLADPRVSDRIAQFEVEVMALEAMVMRTMSEAASGHDSGPRASMIKIRWSELVQQITEYWSETLGYETAKFGPIGNDIAADDGPWPAKGMLYARVTSIYGGANEVQRNIIARRALSL